MGLVNLPYIYHKKWSKCQTKIEDVLVGGFNPSEKYESKLEILPNYRG